MGDSQDTSRAVSIRVDTSIRGLPKDWRRRPGHPRRTWLRAMEADLQPLNHGLNSAWRLAQDRERWKQLVETATLQSGACPRWWWWWWWWWWWFIRDIMVLCKSVFVLFWLIDWLHCLSVTRCTRSVLCLQTVQRKNKKPQLYKKKSSCNHGLFAFSESIKYLSKCDAKVCCARVDASNAFDNVLHNGWLKKLLNMEVGLPVVFVRLLGTRYSQLVCYGLTGMRLKSA